MKNIKKLLNISMIALCVASLEAAEPQWSELTVLDSLKTESREEPFSFYALASNPGDDVAITSVGSEGVDRFNFSPVLTWNSSTEGWLEAPALLAEPQLYTKVAVLPQILSHTALGAGVVQQAHGGIASSFLINGSWTEAQTVTAEDTAQFPNIALNGNVYNLLLGGFIPLAIAVWNQTTATGESALYYSTYYQGEAPDYSWQPPLLIPGAQGTFANVTCDVMGHSVVAWVNPATNTVDAASVAIDNQPDTGIWSPVTSVGSSNLTYPRLKQDAAGNAVLVWIDADGNVNGSTLTLGGSWSSATILSATANNSNPSLAVDPFGNAVAVWQDGSNNIFAANLPFEGNWSAPVVLSANGIGFAPEVSVDTLGNAIAVWFDDQPNINYALLPVNQSWTAATQLPTTLTGSTYPKVGSDGDSAVTIVCQQSNGEAGLQLVTTSITNLFPPVAPRDFQARRVTELVCGDEVVNVKLTWKPTYDTSADHYEIYRNRKLIAVIPFNGPYNFKDTTSDTKCNNVYTLVAVNGIGNTSTPLSARA